MQRRFISERSHMQTAEGDMAAASAIDVGDLIGAVGIGDVHLDHHQFRLIVVIAFEPAGPFNPPH